MGTYIMLASLTDQGVRTVKELPRWLQGSEQLFRSMGAELRDVYLVMGPYDWVVIFEAPSDEVAAKLALAVGAQGNNRTQTLRAFGRAETLKLVEALP
jgi:uncharacterized protein with GYD domain